MPRIQVYLPDDLHRQVKELGLPASELLQTAVAAEVRRRELVCRADQYIEELLAEVGQPSERELARADAITARLQARALAAAAV
ncbi:MAG: hypothetical protein LBR19_08745 [Bifidobacteriaceae bacterium]|jgi:post-segregation antitoxin (ccd killing protein)|nr:hypothetical protein [Bifidobacteriaceae bacterium]